MLPFLNLKPSKLIMIKIKKIFIKKVKTEIMSVDNKINHLENITNN